MSRRQSYLTLPDPLSDSPPLPYTYVYTYHWYSAKKKEKEKKKIQEKQSPEMTVCKKPIPYVAYDET